MVALKPKIKLEQLQFMHTESAFELLDFRLLINDGVMP